MKLPDYFHTARRELRINVGALVVTTANREARLLRNAFSLGQDHGAAFGSTPSPEPERRLRVVS